MAWRCEVAWRGALCHNSLSLSLCAPQQEVAVGVREVSEADRPVTHRTVILRAADLVRIRVGPGQGQGWHRAVLLRAAGLGTCMHMRCACTCTCTCGVHIQ